MQRLLSSNDEISEALKVRRARGLTGWTRDSDLLNLCGQRRTLQLGGDKGFASLVRRHCGDVPPRAVLDELLRDGAVVQLTDCRLAPATRGYLPQRGEAERLNGRS